MIALAVAHNGQNMNRSVHRPPIPVALATCDINSCEVFTTVLNIDGWQFTIVKVLGWICLFMKVIFNLFSVIIWQPQRTCILLSADILCV